MIHVIVLTRNKNYAIYHVPTNGKLYIKEEHILVGVVENGVKMLPFGDVLTPFETFCIGEILDVALIPPTAWHQEGRLLDFTNIELLQASQTVHPSQSGSTKEFIPPSFESGGYPVEYKIRLKGANFQTTDEVENVFQTTCNSISMDGVYQLLSLPLITKLQKAQGLDAYPITEFYDIGNCIQRLEGGVLTGLHELEILSLPVLQYWSNVAVNDSLMLASIKLIDVPTLPFFGVSEADAVSFKWYANYVMPQGVQFNVPRSMETCNAGALEGTLQGLITQNKNPNINYIG